MRDPAGHHIGGAGGPMPLDGKERQVDVLAVTERAAGRHDLGQHGGELGRPGGVGVPVLAVVGLVMVLGHCCASERASMTAKKPARCAGLTRMSTLCSSSRTAADTVPAARWPARVSETRNDRRSAGSTSRTT